MNSSPIDETHFYESSSKESSSKRSRKMDDIDMQIIHILRRNGRTPTVEVARQLNVSEGTIRKRLRRLEKENIIQIVATSSINLLGFRQEMKVLLKTEPQKTREVIDKLKALSRVRYIAIVGGSFNVDMVVAFESDQAAARFLVDDLAQIEGISEVNAMPMLRVVKRSYDWLADEDLPRLSNTSDES